MSQAALLPNVLIVAGPTCSGKSALALAIARRFGGTVINADSMQIYRELRTLTARPSLAEEAALPHRLYGVRPAAEPGSVAWWRDAAAAEISMAVAAGRLPILCGGTGLYFHALRHGLAAIPDIDPAARQEARGLLAEEGAGGLHSRLSMVDPETAAALRPSDSQRLARAWEVWRSTGRGLRWWQGQPAQGALPCRFGAILLDPSRQDLRDAIGHRFATMLADAALDEVRALLALGLDPALPAMRAHGVPELAGYLRGEWGLEEAAQRACMATGRYTKRQTTWFRHHDIADKPLTHTINARIGDNAQLLEKIMLVVDNFICDRS